MTNPQPTPPAGDEILTPEVARMKPEGMKYFVHGKWELTASYQAHYSHSAPLGTNAMLTTPEPEEGECECDTYVGTKIGEHFTNCPAHPRNALVKVLPGWLAGLKEKPEGLVWAWTNNKVWNEWANGTWPKPDSAIWKRADYAYAVPRRESQRPLTDEERQSLDAFVEQEFSAGPWSRDPIHDEVAKMDENKLQGEQISTQQESEVKPCTRTSTQDSQSAQPAENSHSNVSASNAAPADGPNPSPGAAELWVVKWRSRITGFTGQGEPMSKPNAEAWARQGNLDDIHRTLTHWIEPADVSRTPQPVAGSGPTADLDDCHKIAYELWNNNWLDKDSIRDAAQMIYDMLKGEQ